MYRKLFEPAYKEVSPEVILLSPEADVYHAEDPEVCRARLHMESIAEFNASWRGRACYAPVMEVEMKKYLAGGSVPVNVYFPLEKGPHPLMLYYHGGGFCSHNPDTFDLLTRYLCRYGNMTVVSVDYRLAPEHKYPAAPQDCYTALEWAVENADELRADINNISVCGDSAGGNLAAVISLMARDKKGPKIHKQILIFPVTVQKLERRTDSEIRYAKGYFIEIDSTKEMTGSYFARSKDAVEPYASPLLAEYAGDLPAACFISAECDPLLDQGLMYAAKLKDAGVDVSYHIYEGMLHGFINRPYGKSYEALNEICRFVNS